MSPLIILTGPPGAGKSTVGRQLASGWDKAVHHAAFADLEHHVLDSTALTSEQTVTEVRRRIDQGDLILT